jgi:predicted TIM-barrel fold metal-dependent hydrolase
LIDFRVRPPYRSFVPSFYKMAGPLPPQQEGEPALPAILRIVYGDSVPSRDERSFDLFLQDMDEAGIGFAVVTGRQDPVTQPPDWPAEESAGVANDHVVELGREYPDRFAGFGGVDTTLPERALDEIKRFKELGLVGVAFDNAQCKPARANDDPALDPLYEYCAEAGLLVSLNGSFVLAPDLSFIDPVQVQHVAMRFPTLQILVAHACWPWVTQICAVALLCPNVFLLPDLYPHMPGRTGYFDGIRAGLQNQVLFSTSYPAMSLKAGAQVVRGLDLGPGCERLDQMTRSAARLLGLDAAKLTRSRR